MFSDLLAKEASALADIDKVCEENFLGGFAPGLALGLWLERIMNLCARKRFQRKSQRTERKWGGLR